MKYLLLAFLMLASFQTARGIDKSAIQQGMLQRLHGNISYTEQVKVLHNLIDLSSSSSEMFRYTNILYQRARRHNDVDVQLEMIRYYANYPNVDTLNCYYQKARLLPVSNNQRETLVLLHYSIVLQNIRYQSDAVKMRTIENLMRERARSQSDLYGRIDVLLSLTVVMSAYAQSDMYKSYLEKLYTLIESLPADGRHALPSVYHVLASAYYSDKGMEKEDLQARTELINFMRRMEAYYNRQGRIYRQYDMSEYITLCSMLKDYSVLTRAQIENINNQIKVLASKNKDIFAAYNSPASIALARYYIAIKQYDKAAPYIHAILQSHSPSYYEECLKYHIETSKYFGNKDHLIDATLEYNKLLEAKNRKELADKSKELQIVYNVDNLTQQVTDLELQKKQEEIASSRRLMHIYLFSLIVVALFSAFISWLWYRSNKLTKSLKVSEKRLQNKQKDLQDMLEKLAKARNDAEMANRMKTMFIQNMNHEIRTPLNAIVGFSQLLADENSGLTAEEKRNYSMLVNDNSDLLVTLVSDVLDIARMESGEMSYNITECSANNICNEAIENVKYRVQPGVRMYFDKPEADYLLKTDGQRVIQVLINYLTNACKYTREGEVKLSYSVNPSAKVIEFAVTDTGIGISADKAEVIFQRFEKLDPFVQGTGLGLHICKLISNALNGQVKLDTTYHGGSRFLFILPLGKTS
jgi:signal transduction histidine kinase